jgi:hypothetical protein
MSSGGPGSAREINTLSEAPNTIASLKKRPDPQGNWHLAPLVPILDNNDREGHGQECDHDFC